MDEEEKYLLELLRQLQEDYHRTAKPIVDRLVRIQSYKAPSFTITAQQAIACGLLKPQE